MNLFSLTDIELIMKYVRYKIVVLCFMVQTYVRPSVHVVQPLDLSAIYFRQKITKSQVYRATGFTFD